MDWSDYNDFTENEINQLKFDYESSQTAALQAKIFIGAFALLALLLTSTMVYLLLFRRRWFFYASLALLALSLLLPSLLSAPPPSSPEPPSLLSLLSSRVLLPLVDSLNPIRPLSPLPPLSSISPRALSIFRRAFVADLHADSLLWPKPLLPADSPPVGHVDIPRLLSGNVALQGFTIVTRVPSRLSISSNDAPAPLSDPVLLLSLLQAWPLASLDLFSLAPRVLAQSAKLHAATVASQGKFRIIRYREELIGYASERRGLMRLDGEPGISAGYLGIEGLHALDGKLENVDLFFDAGVRTMGLAHFFDNDVSGSKHGREKGGLTAFGRKVVERMRALHIFVDLAHASSETIREVCSEMPGSEHPLIVSHAGVKGVCANNRNLDDEEVRCVARSGGILGVAFFRPAICGEDELRSILDTITYIRDLVGIDHVALGSDFDGSVNVPFDVSKLVYIADGLLQRGFNETEISAVLGENQLRLFSQYLPSKDF